MRRAHDDAAHRVMQVLVLVLKLRELALHFDLGVCQNDVLQHENRVLLPQVHLLLLQRFCPSVQLLHVALHVMELLLYLCLDDLLLL